jgi:hypothetical protein
MLSDSNSKEPNASDTSTTGETSASQTIYNYLVYGLSLPERTLRSGSAVLSGALKESAQVLVPKTFQDSRTYQMFISQMLNFAARDVGGVRPPVDSEPDLTTTENYVAKKAVSNFLELAALTTLHASPLTILAVVSDVTHGSNYFLKELSQELKSQGVIAPDTVIDSTADFLAAVSRTTGQTASLVDLPPLSLAALQESLQSTQATLRDLDPAQILPQAEVQRLWEEVRGVASENNVSLLQVGSAMSMFTLNRVGQAVQGTQTAAVVVGQMVKSHLWDHYRDSLSAIRERGWYPMLNEVSQPYWEAVWYNFSSTRPTWTADLLNGVLARKAGEFWKGLWQKQPADSTSTGQSDPPQNSAAKS